MNDTLIKMRTYWYILKYQYLLRRAVFGKDLRVSCKLIILGPGKVIMGNHCRIESDPWGDDYVTLFTHRKKAKINVGDHAVIRASRFGSHLEIHVGDRAVIESASVYDSDFHNVDATKRDDNFNEGDRRVVIGNDAYVGVESLCSKGTVIGNGALLMAASVIGTKTLPDNTLSAGLPARILGNL